MCEVKINDHEKKNTKFTLYPGTPVRVENGGPVYETRVDGYAIYCKHEDGPWELTPVLEDGVYLMVPTGAWLKIERILV